MRGIASNDGGIFRHVNQSGAQRHPRSAISPDVGVGQGPPSTVGLFYFKICSCHMARQGTGASESSNTEADETRRTDGEKMLGAVLTGPRTSV